MKNIIFSTKNIDDVLVDIANEVVKRFAQNYPDEKKSADGSQNEWYNLDEVIKYDPVKRTKATWYTMVSRGFVPYHKSGNRLMFLKSEIDEWLKSGKHKTKSEIKSEVRSYLVSKKRKGRYEK